MLVSGSVTVSNMEISGQKTSPDVLCCIAGCQDLVELYAAGEEPRPDVNDCHRSMRGAKKIRAGIDGGEYIKLPVVPGQAGGGSFQKEKNYIAKKEFAYRMCARRPTSAMPKSFLCLCSPSAVPWW